MRQVLADFSVSISELKKNPSALLSQASGSPIAVLNHNKPAAYLIPAETYEALMDMLEDLELAKLVEERRGDKDQAIAVSLDDLSTSISACCTEGVEKARRSYQESVQEETGRAFGKSESAWRQVKWLRLRLQNQASLSRIPIGI